ncbi:cAMP-binding domain of CRP or a regulatory subunit of cAMP-dependent protein kinases [Loktanella fryxellensis]|uniref:cAMP-binding domain of CRP or a regulatory subunit of cAMP-dependent protein kinases n=1 Tax=Loktanella fryxellensis TaxID=245187 RepID=A0A1H8HAX9_9RHOB|nr:Crp/Fnr family transcriptional regulator [Loktanella fryxellensis]SEN52967.1 cAMP-binding domain of CRP or a regulatory subunit of cAMP-dependent protein kinases [Loktanella fryxellensis]
MSPSSSCLVTKLSHYITLDDGHKDHLARLEKAERAFASGAEVYQAGDVARDMYVVKRGWLFSYTDLPDGRRQIVKIHHPGDIIGFPDVAMKHMTTTLHAAEDVVLCPFPKSSLDEILSTSPRLSALMLSIGLRDQVVFIDLLRVMGRMKAQERVAFMLLDLIARLRITNTSMTDTIRLPLNQSQIGDYLGLTNVYISRTFIRMEEEGLILRRADHLQLLQEQALAEMCDFYDRYSDMDTSWFPEH